MDLASQADVAELAVAMMGGLDWLLIAGKPSVHTTLFVFGACKKDTQVLPRDDKLLRDLSESGLLPTPVDNNNN